MNFLSVSLYKQGLLQENNNEILIYYEFMRWNITIF